MRGVMPNSVFLFSYSGCLVPFLLVANFLFGWMFLNFKQWLLVEAVLLLLLWLNSFILSKKITRNAPRRGSRRGVIDVEGKIVDDPGKPRLK